MNQPRGLSPAFFCFGLCLTWKAFAAPYCSQLPVFTLLPIVVPLVVLLVISARKDFGKRTPSWVVWAAGIMGCMATALLGFSELPADGGPSLPVGLFQTATGILLAVYSLFFILWAEMYAGLDVVIASISIGGSYLLASMGFFIFGLIGPAVCLGISIMLPLMSAWALLACRNASPVESVAATEVISLHRLVSSNLFPWRIIVAITAVSLAAGLSRARTTTSEDLLAVGVAGLVFVAFVLISRTISKSYSVYQAIRASFLFMAAALLSGVALGDGALAHLFIGVGQTLSSIVLVILICDNAHRFGLPAVPVLATARTFSSVAFIAGGALGERLHTMTVTPTFGAPMVYLAAVAVVTVVACAYWLHQPRDVGATSQTATTASGGKNSATQNDGNQVLLAALEEQVRLRSKQLALEYCLTKRETDILTLLAWGKSAKRIEEILTLSPNTVKTHVRHVYEKLGIHSRAELDALLFNVSRDQTPPSCDR